MSKQVLATARSTQGKRILRNAAGAVNKARLTESEARDAAGSRKFQQGFIALLRDCSAKVDWTLARSVLGNDFVAPEDIAKARRGVVYTPEEIAGLCKTLPNRKELQWLRDNGFILVAGPPKPMSLLEIRDLKNEYLYSKTGGWYSGDKEKFSRDDKATAKWLKLRKGPVPNSTSKSWSEQQPLLSDIEYVPNAAEAVWGVTSYKAVRGVYLLPNVYVRTSNLDSDGYRVSVGFFDAGGLYVYDDWDDDRYELLGLASARK